MAITAESLKNYGETGKPSLYVAGTTSLSEQQNFGTPNPAIKPDKDVDENISDLDFPRLTEKEQAGFFLDVWRGQAAFGRLERLDHAFQSEEDEQDHKKLMGQFSKTAMIRYAPPDRKSESNQEKENPVELISSVQAGVEAFNRIAFAHIPLVRSRLRHNTFYSFEINQELFVEAFFGLQQQIAKYDPKRNVKFTTFAIIRIDGQINDYYRKISPYPKVVNKTIKEIEKLNEEAETELSDEELAEEMGISTIKVKNAKNYVPPTLVYFSQIKAPGTESDEKTIESSLVSREIGYDFTVAIENNDSLKRALNGLPPQYQLAIFMRYRLEMELAEIGKELEVSESRICHIIKNANSHLAEMLSE